MKLLIKTFAVTVLLATINTYSYGATISLMPGTLEVETGVTFSLDLVVSGLSDSSAPSVGVFDIDIGFDPFAVMFVGYSLGNGLGDLSLGEAFDASFGLALPGLLNVAEVSFLTAGELDGGQPDNFVLATLDFVTMPGLDPGQTTAIDILNVLSLGDSNGDPLMIDGTNGSVITATAVPIPGAMWLFMCALGVLSATRTAPQP